jgi:alcohol dehydrogenase class IV
MVNTFTLSRIPQILFGPGSREELPAIINKFGHTVLIITGASSFKSSDIGKKLLSKLENEKLEFYRVRIIKEPSPSDVDEIVQEYIHKNIKVVVAVGGGSALDTGKAVSAMLPSGENLKDYLEGVGAKVHSGVKLPFIAVPTTSGTGSEATNNAVISEIGERGFKKSLRHNNFVPDYAIVDPQLTISCPPEITAASGMDAFSQLLESYLSDRTSLFTDSLAIEGLRCIKASLLKAYADGKNLEARTDMAYAAMISGITLTNSGLGVVHGFASALGGYYDIPHGIACGTLMGIANRINVEVLIENGDNPVALSKYASVGKIFSDVTGRDDRYYAGVLVDYIEGLIRTLKLPRLGAFGIKTEQIDKLINATSIKNNPALLDKEDLRDIILARI